MFIQTIVLASTLAIVSASTVAEKLEFIRCAKAGNAALEGLTSQQLIDLTQKNLVTATAMVNKRSNAARQQGLNCYYDFNMAYGPAFNDIVGPTGEPKVLSKATSDAQRAKVIQQIAGMTQLVICDEQYRANHMNDTIQCNLLEQNGGALVEFSTRLPIIETLMGVGGTLLKFVSPPMDSVVTQMKNLYQQLYTTGKQCSQNPALPPAQRCANLKMFDLELARL
ncbi:unnamed protein product, partial [Oppiella nova]